MSEKEYEAVAMEEPKENTTANVESLLHENPSFCKSVGEELSSCDFREALETFFPGFNVAKNYKLDYLLSDFIAGITVGLTVIPQGIAYAILAELPPEYGLYSAFVPCFLYAIFGTVTSITIGPTALMALMTSTHAAKHPDMAVFLAFNTGIVVTICGLLKLGFLADFVSGPVIAGFISAAAFTIATGQMKGLLGLSITEKSGYPGILGSWWDICANIRKARINDTILGVTCIVILLSLRQLKRWKCIEKRILSKLPKPAYSIFTKLIWFASTARNAIVVLSCAVIAAVLVSGPNDNSVLVLTGEIKAGFPRIELPRFSVNMTSGSGEDSILGFWEMVNSCGSTLALLPMVAILEHMAIARGFSSGSLNASQELFTMGLSNLFGSFFQSMTVTASFGRTAVNAASNVKTTLGGIFTGILVILCLTLLLPYCAFIPKATLSAVIICAVIFSIEVEVVRPIWRSNRIELIPGFVTFLACLFWALDYGILLGIFLHLAFVLAHVSRPEIRVNRKLFGSTTKYDVIWIAIDRGLEFPSHSFIKTEILRQVERCGAPGLPAILDCRNVVTLDYTSAESILDLQNELKKKENCLILFRLSDSNSATLKGASHDKILIARDVEEIWKILQGTGTKDI